MIIFKIINEILKVTTLLAAFTYLVDERVEDKKSRAAAIGMICLCGGLKTVGFLQGYLCFAMEMALFGIYLRLFYRRSLLHKYMYLFALYVILDVCNMILAAASFPVIALFRIRADTWAAEIIKFVLKLAMYTGFVWFAKKRRASAMRFDSKVSQIGLILIFSLIECAFQGMRHMGYDQKNIMVYRMLLVVIVLGSVICVLWIYDKRQEQEKMRELTAYSHRTREIIPSVGRAIQKLDELTAHLDQTQEVLSELREICNEDMAQVRKETAVIKTFDSTGNVMLDEQLKRYLEEAAEQGFTLDIIVRAPVKEVLEQKQIRMAALLQIVGDLYRNAYKVVLRKEGKGRILLCFGYNQEGYYEISVYDNGELFPAYVKRHLGKRGVTTGGTGHGMADVFEVLEENRISFVLDERMPERSIFTKGISLLFDGKGTREIRSR